MTAQSDSPHAIGVDAAWTFSIEQTLNKLGSNSETGLDSQTAIKLQQRYGPNQLRTVKARSILSIITDQFRSMVVLLLAAAGTLALVFSNFTEAFAIFAVIVINSMLGFVTEWRAIRSMESLKKLGAVITAVIRDGIVKQIPAGDIVPGDIVVLDGGDIVTADIRLLESSKLQANESMLTGESLPLSKQTEPLSADLPIMDRNNMVFKGTIIARGSGKGVVVAIGLGTELGSISKLVSEAESAQTPLEKRLNALSERLSIVVLMIAVGIAIAGILAGRGTFLAIEVAVALAVAAIPEGLPIVATIALARGMWRMAKRNALIAKLSAVETLGATSIILTDKTGTLTENQMAVTEVLVAGIDGASTLAKIDDAGILPSLLKDLLATAVLCNNASLQQSSDGESHSVGDPTELALLAAAAIHEIRRDDLLRHLPELAEIPFDPDTKLMATVHEKNSGALFAVKGAPESVAPLCRFLRTESGNSPLSDEMRKRWLDSANELGNRGLRTLAIASKEASDTDAMPYQDLVLLGIVGIEDPARQGVKTAINRCHSAGVEVIMVTGDHPATASNIATQLGIVEIDSTPDRFVNGSDLDDLLQQSAPDALLRARVFSRASPEQKLKIIEFYQRQGHIVAMTGDGVNDAPALKMADIGVAMGIRGTAVAKEAAHMVLQDDEFGSIVEAIAQGRAIYQNIRKFVVYLLSCNISEVLIVSLATIAGAPLPLLPLQILFLNLVTDVFPALALGVGEGSPALMVQKPRPADEPVLTNRHWLQTVLYALVISIAVLGAMAVAIVFLRFDTARAVTVSFCTLALAQLWHVVNMRDSTSKFLSNEVTRNIWIWVAISICLALIIAAIYTTLPSEILGLVNPGLEGWLIVLPMSIMPLVFAPIVRHVAPLE